MTRQQKYKLKKKFEEYNNYIYCIDIETSTQDGINSDGESVRCSFIISYAISKIDIFNGKISHVVFNRNYTQLENDIELIQEKSKGKKTLIYIHNFSYEWSFFKDNISFFKNNITNMLFMKQHKPLIINCNNLSFRCSYLLLGKSVASLGNELTSLTGENWRKLEFDYIKNRTPLTPISNEEKAYNFKDCDIVLKYIYVKLISKYDIKDLYNEIYTQTGIVRFENKKNNTNNDYKGFLLFNKSQVPKTQTQYNIEQLSFMGGLVSFDFKVINKVLNNIGSFDIASSYPFQMLRPYPTHFILNTELTNIDTFEKFRKSEKYNKSKFWYGIIKIKDLELNNLDYAILSGHKLFESVDCDEIFGKVVKAKQGVLICTSLDFENYKKFYKFDVVEIREIYTNKYMNYLSKFILKSIARLLENKTKLKEYNNEVKHKGELYNNYSFDDNFKYLQDSLNEQTNYQIQRAIIEQEYLRIKGHLNSCYGILVESSIKDNITYDFEQHQYIKSKGDFEKFKNKRFIKTNMCVGTFITAYARNHLITLLHLLLTNNINVYYTDTDSLKIDMTKEHEIFKIIEDYNNRLFENPYNIGQFEFEGTYKHFVVNGNKSYLTVDDKNNISATIAGLPSASEIYQQLYDRLDCNFDKLIKKCFSFNIEILPEVTDKLTSKYPVQIDDLENDTQIIHLSIGKYDDYVYTGLILDDCPVTIKGIDTSLHNTRSIANLYKYYNFDTTQCYNKFQIYLNKEKDKPFIDVKENGIVSDFIKRMLKGEKRR